MRERGGGMGDGMPRRAYKGRDVVFEQLWGGYRLYTQGQNCTFQRKNLLSWSDCMVLCDLILGGCNLLVFTSHKGPSCWGALISLLGSSCKKIPDNGNNF